MIRPYTVHYRDGWEAIANDNDVPRLTRLVGLAYARNDSNGHAQFGLGELMSRLSISKQQVQRLIKRAVAEKWLDPLSFSTCLVVPAHISDRRHHAGACETHARKAVRQRARKVTEIGLLQPPK